MTMGMMGEVILSTSSRSSKRYCCRQAMQLHILVVALACCALVPRVLASYDVWIIRHCDKDDGNCCTAQGVDRAVGWAEYFKGHLSLATGIVTSNYAEESNTCMKGVAPAQTDAKCQGSQRMFDTAFLLSQSMGHPTSAINVDFCSGLDDTTEMAAYMARQPMAQLCVWEHKQIVDIIRAYGINLDSWPDSLSDTYNLVFRVQLGSSSSVGGAANGANTMQYACYNYKSGSPECDKGVADWLKNFDKFSN